MKIRITHLLLATIIGIEIFASCQKDAIVFLQPNKKNAIIRSVADAKNIALNFYNPSNKGKKSTSSTKSSISERVNMEVYLLTIDILEEANSSFVRSNSSIRDTLLFDLNLSKEEGERKLSGNPECEQVLAVLDKRVFSNEALNNKDQNQGIFKTKKG